MSCNLCQINDGRVIVIQCIFILDSAIEIFVATDEWNKTIARNTITTIMILFNEIHVLSKIVIDWLQYLLHLNASLLKYAHQKYSAQL